MKFGKMMLHMIFLFAASLQLPDYVEAAAVEGYSVQKRQTGGCAVVNGGCEHTCVNTGGSFYCDCDDGYEVDSDGLSCNDIDECVNRTDNCSRDGEAPADCINLPGGFTCSCHHHIGYRLYTSDYASCEDINECEERIAGCNQLCVNTNGSFECLCQTGYELLDNNRTCVDIDECEVDNGGCEELCVNTPGSYHCLCPRGFILQDDSRTCEARECPLLSELLNGTIICNPPQQPVTTGGYCEFTCDEGFNLMGSMRRTCGPRSTWTGATTFCEPKLCEKLSAPEKGFVLLPCTRALGTSGIIDCEQGYKIRGSSPYRQTCILDHETLEPKWTDPPVCIVSNVCEPNPCEHNGICFPMGESDHSCDCEGTGYMGPTCTTGIVIIPPIPTLVQGIPVNVTVSAQPDMDLSIRIVGGDHIHISPKIITINAPATSADFTISSDTPGLYSIGYQLSGSDGVSFNTPPESPVFVTEISGQGGMNQYFAAVESPVGVLKESCCNPELSYQCPGSSLNKVYFVSGCEWSQNSGGQVSPGVVFVASRDLSLPLSISGIGISNSFDFTLPQSSGPCEYCETNRPIDPRRLAHFCMRDPNQARCVCPPYYQFMTADIPDFLNARSLALTYLQKIQPLFPSWVQSVSVDLDTANPFVDAFAAYEYNTELVPAVDISRIDGCENIETTDRGLYSVLRYARTISATIDGQTLHYSDSSNPPVVGEPMCFAINLCQGASSPLYIELSPETHTVLVSEFLREYVNRGWEITIPSVALLEIGLIVTPAFNFGGQYWNGIVFTLPDIPLTFDMTMNTQSNAYFTSGHLRIKMEFSGKVHYSYEEQKGVMVGDMQMNINCTISGKNTALELTGHTNPATVDVSGTEECNDGNEQLSGIALKLSYRQKPDQIFFSTLMSFSEETTECPVDAFMRMKNATNLLGLSLHTSCPYLNLGMLTFRGLAHRMYFSGTSSFELFCLLDNILSSLPNPSLVIRSSLQGDRLPLGDFLTLLPGSESIALSVAYDRDDSNFIARLHSVSVAILETDFITAVNVDSGGLQLSATTEIFRAYSTNLTISAPINEAPWERLPLSVLGELNNGPNSFIETLESSIHNELRRRADTANRRESSANMTRLRAQEQFMGLERKLNESQEALTTANQTYEEALTQLDVVNIKLVDAQRAFDDAGEEIGQFQALREALFRTLDEARTNVSLARSAVIMAEIQLECAKQGQQQILQEYESVKEANELADIDYEMGLAEIKPELDIRDLLLQHQAEDVISISSVIFSILVVTESPTQIPLQITYSTPYNNQAFMNKTVFDFQATQALAFGEMAMLIIEDRFPDINECAVVNGGCHHTCVSTEGSFYCDCDNGYKLDSDGLSCNDIDECENTTDNCSRDGEAPAECINLPGEFTCSCHHRIGYRLNTSDYASCEDINECEERIAGCNQLCVNTNGSFECLCQNGYELLDDIRTCVDIDECEVDNGGCEEMCVNIPGSYHCLCHRGFILQDDSRTCEARECPLLSEPLNGTITCSPPQQPVTTGGYCEFSCDEGFILMGSMRRTCGPRSIWTGTSTFCEPQLCEKLSAPEKGFVLLPCTRAYGTSCAIDCEQGYKIDGPTPYRQTCILDSELEWTDPPVCILSNVCEPNPCQHNGICSPMGESDLSCDCEGTGYTGPTCTTGIVFIPPIPNLVQGMPINVTASAHPDIYLSIRIVGGDHIHVSPTIVRITAPATSADFTISSDTPGLYSIRYLLTGSDGVNFNPPPDSAVIVTEISGQGGMNQYFVDVDSPVGVLKESCCNPELSYQCPGSSLNKVYFVSGCEWSQNSGGQVSPGVVFVASRDLSLPLSISGIGISNSFDFTLPQSSGPCEYCETNRPIDPRRLAHFCMRDPNQARCVCPPYYQFMTADIPDFLNARSLALTYLQKIQPLFPSWVQSVSVDLDTANPFVDAFAAYEYNTELVPAVDISRIDGCENIETTDRGLYSVLRYARTISATIDGQTLHYSDSSNPPVVGEPMCFAINLCQGASSPLYIELSPETHTVLVSEFLREYVNRGWEITIPSVALLEIGLIVTPAFNFGGQYWNGIVFTLPDIPLTFDMTMNTQSNAYFTSGHLRIKMEFSGKVHYSYEEQKGVMVGDMQMNINGTISGKNTALELTGHTNPATVDVSGTEECNDGNEQLSGIALKLSYRQKPDQIFFSTLMSFSEETTECPVDAFMRMKNATNLLGLSLHTSCPYLNLGMLTFRGMVHQMYFSGTGSFESFCLSDSISSSLPNPSLVIQSSLQGDRLPLGNFLTLLPGSDSIALSVAYDRDDSNFIARLYSVTVSILETDFITAVNVDNGGLQLSATTEVFSAYSTNLTISAPINEAPWQRLPLSVLGELNDGPNSFIETLESSIHNELRRRADTASRRESSANMTRLRAQEQFMELERLLNESQEAVTTANQTYEEALTQLDVAIMKLVDAQRAFDDAGEEIGQFQTLHEVLFRTLDEARTNVSLARSAVTMAEIQLENAKRRQQQILQEYESVKEANELAEINYEMALAEIKPELDIRDLLLQHQAEDVISISSVTFSVLVVTESPTQIPLQITYSTPYNNQTFMNKTVFDFQASQDLSFGEMAMLIIEDRFPASCRFSGWIGTLCSIDLNECVVGNGGCGHTCTNFPGSYSCSCDEGYELLEDQQTCNDTNECLLGTDNCTVDGAAPVQCDNLPGGFRCSCDHLEGYRVNTTDYRSCEDIDECAVVNGGCEHTCVNTGGSFYCGCDDGYVVDSDGLSCNDNDECAVGNGGCDHTCTNHPGSYSCSCDEGYELLEDQQTCNDTNECLCGTDNCTVDGAAPAQCDNLPGGFRCSCDHLEGYRVNTTDYRSCEDIDECTVVNGGCEHTCVNTEGSFYCDCDDGYEVDSDGLSCNDNDECAVGNGGCDHTCTNHPGSYSCSCDEGYELLEDQQTCNDTNECLLGTDNCTVDGAAPAQCDNLPGGFRCSCDHLEGYRVNTTDYRSCEDIDECAVVNGGCEHTCVNTGGSFYCGCDDGYVVDSDGLSCNDIDECENRTDNCSRDGEAPAECINLPGDFTCSCHHHIGYRLNTSDCASCEDIDECEERIAGCNQLCVNANGSFECLCQNGYELLDDNRTCVDIDECEVDNGGCEELCVNTPGSYHCLCPRGFILQDDNRTCEARECPLLSEPLNGTITCSSPQQPVTTGGYCEFSCDEGFILMGSMRRTCGPRSIWTGTSTFCEPKLCEKLSAPEKGFVLLPCTWALGTSCTIDCEQGYKIRGSSPYRPTCILDHETLEPKWTDPPLCIVSDVCEPNPCEHNGICSPMGESDHSCDCEGTGYTGPTCTTGIVFIPPIPNLVQGMPINVTVSALPDIDLTIHIDGGDHIHVSPTIVRITAPATSADFTISSDTPGLYSIRYLLTGSDGVNFNPPPDSAVIVTEISGQGGMNQYFAAVKSPVGVLKESCCNPELSYQCPGSSLNQLYFVSGCEWSQNSGDQVSPGVVFVASRDLSLPLSIRGIGISNSYDFTQPQSPGSCENCENNRPIDPRRLARVCRMNPKQIRCICPPYYPFMTSDIPDFLNARSLALTYLQKIQPLFPSWVQSVSVDLDTANPFVDAFAAYEYNTELVPAVHISRIEGCENIATTDQGLYSVLRYARTISATIDGQTLHYSDSSNPPVVGKPMCFAINLCQGASSPLYIELSPETHTVLVSEFLREYVDRGWEITIRSVALFETGLSMTVDFREQYWNGIAFAIPEIPLISDVIMIMESNARFNSGHLKIKMEFSGKAHYSYVEQRGVMVGDMQMNINCTISGNNTTLQLTDRTNTAIVDLSGTKECSNGAEQLSGIALKLSYRQKPDQIFFSKLMSFSEETTECPVDAFMRMKNATDLLGLSLHTSCPYLNLGMLTFRGMVHQMYFSGTGSFESFCLSDSISSSLPNPSLVIQSSLQGDRLPLGNFLTLLPGSDSIALSVAYDRDDSNFIARLYSVTVSILETDFITAVNVDNGGLQLSATTEVFSAYSTNLTISAPINEAPWERLPLSVLGEMNNGPNSFVETLESSIHNELRRRADTASRRESSANMTRLRAQEQFMGLERKLNESQEAVTTANQTYEEALTQLDVVIMKLVDAQRAFDDAGEEIGQFQTLHEALFRTLDEARTNVSLAKSALIMAEIQLDNVKQRQQQILPAYESVKEANELAEINYEMALAEIKAELDIRDLLLQHQAEDVISISSVTFSVLVVTESPTQIPLQISYSTPYNNQTFMNKTVFDFQGSQALRFRELAETIIDDRFQVTPPTRKRSVNQQWMARRLPETIVSSIVANGIHFVKNSPRIVADSVEADFTFTGPSYSVTCQISRHQEKECSSGNVIFTDLEPGRYVLRVAATNSKEDRAIERRRFEITSDPSFCTVHLINDGVTVRGGGGATVEFTGTGPAEGFSCQLDRDKPFQCSSPVELSGLEYGKHQLKITPLGCSIKKHRPLTVKFNKE